MRLPHHWSCMERETEHPSRRGGFTMVEIAIALAVIGFALVAIIGVLPSGLEVQKDNREETIINQDAVYFMDAIRSGARGADDLTNYVYEIRRFVQDYNASTNPVGGTVTYVYNQSTSTRDGVTMSPEFPLTNGFRIIGLLATPKYIPQTGGFQSNHLVAYVRALSGPASEKFPQRDTNVQGLAFSYRFTSEVVSVPLPTPDLASPFTNTPYARHLRANLNEVRLLFRWPMFANGQTGNGRQVFRSQVSGRLTTITNDIETLYFFEPTTFVNAYMP
jgi:type II secretory pathway pseudopilin PulG